MGTGSVLILCRNGYWALGVRREVARDDLRSVFGCIELGTKCLLYLWR